MQCCKSHASKSSRIPYRHARVAGPLQVNENRHALLPIHKSIMYNCFQAQKVADCQPSSPEAKVVLIKDTPRFKEINKSPIDHPFIYFLKATRERNRARAGGSLEVLNRYSRALQHRSSSRDGKMPVHTAGCKMKQSFERFRGQLKNNLIITLSGPGASCFLRLRAY